MTRARRRTTRSVAFAGDAQEVFVMIAPESVLKQGIDEGRGSRARQQDQHAEEQQDEHDREQPPLLVVGEEREEFAEQILLIVLRGGLLELAAGSFVHGSCRSSK